MFSKFSGLNINVNHGQNKFEFHISKRMAKIANFQPKIGQCGTLAPTLNGYNSAIFYQISTSESDHTKMINSWRRIEWCTKLSSITFRIGFGLTHFLLRGLKWAVLRALSQAISPNPKLGIVFSKLKGRTHPP